MNCYLDNTQVLHLMKPLFAIIVACASPIPRAVRVRLHIFLTLVLTGLLLLALLLTVLLAWVPNRLFANVYGDGNRYRQRHRRRHRPKASQKCTNRLLGVEPTSHRPSPKSIHIGYTAFPYIPGQCLYVLLPGGDVSSPIIYIFSPAEWRPFSSPQSTIIYDHSSRAYRTKSITFQTFINNYLRHADDEEFLIQPDQENKTIFEDFRTMVKHHNGGHNRKCAGLHMFLKNFPNRGVMLVYREKTANYLAMDKKTVRLETREQAETAKANN